MKFKTLSIAISLALSITSEMAFANEQQLSAIEVITIKAPKLTHSETALAEGNLVMPDVADWLKTVPGADINKNGPITGIAQYRGMYGDRIAKSISGHQIISAGPNAMDAPLTYINPIMVDSVAVYRGIAPISSGIDTLGGSVEVNLKRALPNKEFEITGDLATSYNDINNASNLAGDINFSGNNLALLAYVSNQKGDDYESANEAEVKSTQYDKKQHGTDLRYAINRFTLGVTWHHSETKNSGTPALPMDIDYIKSDRYNHDGEYDSENWQLNWQFGYQDATHGMDNFSQRENNILAKHRYNTADAKTLDYKIEYIQDELTLGFEGFDSEHNSNITNPDNMMFNVLNFNKVIDERNSIYAQWQPSIGETSYTFGVRLKNNKADAKNVATSMAMMSMHVKALQDAFNSSDKSVSDTTYDIALNSQKVLSDNTSLNYAIAIKQRAASYQERYLWLPMQATGGLADGKTYVGNINLEPETAYQLDVGYNYEAHHFAIAPHLFYQKVNDYIQGTPSKSMHVKMVANMMMGDEMPLEFTNINAKLFGADLNWHYKINDKMKLSGIASYVRGKRDDINDDLYRIMPLNTRININYHHANWQTNLALHAYNKQTHTSELNNEKTSAGYAVIDWQLDYFLTTGLVVRGGVNNLLNKEYSDHLAGINRANGSEIEKGQRIPAMGRNVYLAMDYQF
ncbi:TonB-dependent receptor [Pseudoalteromonas denitrificans]|uniref:Iron complex outermembrane recepter protein n=1 Tax=Pseudoalteromonas denitrificans DSM 6059 TaxID=1123010 RepID=A0A1I1FEE3_9GAMM|nr:TonB-dependent receptor [Pseudoalteromonas denitrificans]SFB97745.1 iron complex outermembrane recepter protein [Pseudoalteromonas denitrificans DSM 6059]